MSDDQQIIVPANGADDCLTEQPPQSDAAAAAPCPVQPPKDEDAAACLVQPPKDEDAAACTVQPPKDEDAAACPLQSPNDEAEIMDVVMSSNDDDAAGPAPPPNNDAAIMSDVDMPSQDDDDAASPAPPPDSDAAKMSDVAMSSQDDDDAGLSLPSNIDAGPATPPKEDAIPSMVKDEPGCSSAKRPADDDDDARVDFKKEIKHETIDLGNDTYFYDDNNKAILVKGPPRVGFDRGLEPDHIVGATEQDGKLMFLIAWKNSEVADLLESTEVYDRAPQIAIQFFEARLRYCPTADRN